MSVIYCELAWMEPGCIHVDALHPEGFHVGFPFRSSHYFFFLFITLMFTLNTVNNPLTLCIVAYPERVDCLMLINTQTTKAGWMEWGYQKRNVSHLRYILGRTGPFVGSEVGSSVLWILGSSIDLHLIQTNGLFNFSSISHDGHTL